ncbi:peptide chain release factor 1 [Candidatus Methylomirabilis oxygeniifera]|uniref:Peptide chain release factor 1 n=1 Tax=Methylomirabilis oxygeniifera TaxID=671143 RepID=D5MI06_METO1|nr:peptide chain release factor 1 [Candidatus Methylomirabilis oxyfera]
MLQLRERLDAIEQRSTEVLLQMGDPAIITDQARFQRLAKAHAELEPVVEAYQQYRKLLQDLEETKALLHDGTEDDVRELAEAELKELAVKREKLEEELTLLLLPRDPADEKSIILEVRAGAGGDEAALFAAELVRMYGRYAELRGWKVEMLSSSQTGVGGVKEAILSIEGRGAYSRLKFESGVHRVQRVPVTESSGRIHTSTVTVAVLPEAEDVEIQIDPKDLRIDVFRSTGPGGQSVNTTDSAVRITHLPTGMVVSCQDEKSQHKNRAKAMKVLRARLLEAATAQQAAEISQARRQQVGTGDRSERIRTYNFPQGRVTDHRIGLTLHSLPRILEGEIEELIGALAASDQAARLKALV